MSFSIRIAESPDWQPVRQLLREAGLPSADLDETRMDDFLLAESPDGDLLGAIGIESYGRSALLRSLVISPGARQSGLGRALVERLSAVAAASGTREIWLLTVDAAAFFERLGFEARRRDDVPAPIRGTEEFSSLCPADATVMYRIIAG